MAVKLDDIQLKIYSENLPENWWDGRFSVMQVGVSEINLIESVSSNPFRRKIVTALSLLDPEKAFVFSDLCLSSFQVVQDGEYVSHPFFQIEEASALVKRCLANSRMSILKLYFDTTGYGVQIDENKITSFSPVMLRPFQGQTGYCIGAIKRVTNVGAIGDFPREQMSFVPVERLLKEVDWQCLLRFAKPYSNYFAVAGVEKIQSKYFRYLHGEGFAVPLYLGNHCIGARLKMRTGLKYVSYETYLKYFF